MVWLDVAGNNGSALYFVTDRVERLLGRGTAGFSVTGIVGDGQYEGEVIVDVGAEAKVTYVDAWLAAGVFDAFAKRIDIDRVTAALTEAAERAASCLGGRSSRERRSGRASRVAESAPVWRAVA